MRLISVTWNEEGHPLHGERQHYLEVPDRGFLQIKFPDGYTPTMEDAEELIAATFGPRHGKITFAENYLRGAVAAGWLTDWSEQVLTPDTE